MNGWATSLGYCSSQWKLNNFCLRCHFIHTLSLTMIEQFMVKVWL